MFIINSTKIIPINNLNCKVEFSSLKLILGYAENCTVQRLYPESKVKIHANQSSYFSRYWIVNKSSMSTREELAKTQSYVFIIP